MPSAPRFRVSPDVVYRDLDGEAVILNLASGTYFGLNAVASRMWALLDDGLGHDEIVAALAAEFAAPPETIASDFRQLTADLESRGLVTRVAAPTDPP